ncbi:MAG: transketolase [Alphaproteobacteria bacterium]|jgi:transketolase|nr:transketolase [Alphaproteobacteria bacterium]
MAENTNVTHDQMANAIRALSMDAVEAANSGHPGMPMGMADVATVLFTKFLKYDPSQPDWADRDRFVLSAGHGSMLLYSLLYLTGYPEMTIDEIKHFRQLGAKTAGHPEYGHAPGIETTTGPLGQGIATAVGMAIAERHLAAEFGDDVVDHTTYVIAGDGCLMEGISHEAISFAGHLRLGKLVVMWDDNDICIDGPTSMTVSDDQIARFKASGWNTMACDGHDPAAVEKCLAAAQGSDKPTFIACKTTIAFGSPNKGGTSAAHGAALGADEIAATRKQLGWEHGPFEIPQDIMAAWRLAGTRAAKAAADWQIRLDASAKKAEFGRRIAGILPENWLDAVNALKIRLADEAPAMATRNASQEALEVINPAVPETVGGSADLTGSVNTLTKDLGALSSDNYGGRYVHYGVREHAMGAAMNGMALHGGMIPYAGTFFVFTDYLRPAMRLSALMGIRVIYVMTHDSIGLGEDGPTHQPVEHLASVRSMPNVMVLRPADAVETAECWSLALQNDTGPSVMVLTRQKLPALRTTHTDKNLCAMGGYEISPAEGDARVSLLATGSEVSLAVEAQKLLAAEGVPARVVSIPCWELLEALDEEAREAVLGVDTVRIAVEAGVSYGWDRYVGSDGAFVGMTSFGASAPAPDLYEHFGITAKEVAAAAIAHL